MPDKFRSSINCSSFTSGSNDQSFNSGTSDAIVKSLITPDKKFSGTDFFKFKRQHFCISSIRSRVLRTASCHKNGLARY